MDLPTYQTPRILMSRDTVATRIIHREHQFNTILIRLLYQEDRSQEEQWKQQVREVLQDVADMRVKPQGKPVTQYLYYHLFWESWNRDDNPSEYVDLTVRCFIEPRNSVKQNRDLKEMSDKLVGFHQECARLCGKGHLTDPRIEQLILEFCS